MSIVKDLLLIIVLLILFFVLKKNISLSKELFNQRDYFIKTLSHDLKVSALAQIRGLDLLQRKYQNEELITDIDESCKYSLDMINMLLNTYQYENGKQVLNYETFNFSDLVKNSCSKLDLKAQEKNIEILCGVNKSEPIRGDKIELAKTLNYLLATSIYYSARGKKIIFVARKKQDILEVTINYSGTPLSEEECRRMFSNNPRFSTVGHGIKMHLCKKIIEFHGGKIHVNNCGQNSNSFSFFIPISDNLITAKPVLTSKLQPFQL